MMNLFRLWLFSVFTLVGFFSTHAQVRITFKEEGNDEPIPFVTAMVVGMGDYLVADSLGNMVLSSPNKSVTLITHHLSFVSDTLLVSTLRTADTTIYLVPKLLALDEIVIKPTDFKELFIKALSPQMNGLKKDLLAKCRTYQTWSKQGEHLLNVQTHSIYNQYAVLVGQKWKWEPSTFQGLVHQDVRSCKSDEKNYPEMQQLATPIIWEVYALLFQTDFLTDRLLKNYEFEWGEGQLVSHEKVIITPKKINSPLIFDRAELVINKQTNAITEIVLHSFRIERKLMTDYERLRNRNLKENKIHYRFATIENTNYLVEVNMEQQFKNNLNERVLVQFTELPISKKWELSINNAKGSIQAIRTHELNPILRQLATISWHEAWRNANCSPLNGLYFNQMLMEKSNQHDASSFRYMTESEEYVRKLASYWQYGWQ